MSSYNDYQDFDFAKKELESKIFRMKESRKKSIENYTNERKEEAYKIIRESSESGGLTLKRFAELMGLSRERAYVYTRLLLKENKIKKNEKRKWVVTDESIYDLTVKAEFLGAMFSSLLEKSDFNVLNESSIGHHIINQVPSKEVDPVHKEDFLTYKKLFEPKFSEHDQLEKILFEFSNQIGSFIVYSMIYCMNHEGLSKLDTRFEKEMTVLKTFQKSLSILPSLLPRFRDFLDRFYGLFPKDLDQKTEYFKTNSDAYYLDGNILSKLLLAFFKLYPLMTYEFEKVLDERYFFKDNFKENPSSYEHYKKRIMAYNIWLENQEKCKHMYEEKPRGLQQCKLCGFVSRIKKPGPRYKRNKKTLIKQKTR